MLSVTNSILLLAALCNFVLAVFILRGNWKKPTNTFLGVFLGALCLWALSLIGTQIGSSYLVWLYAAKASYITGLIIAASFYLFSFTFTKRIRPPARTIALAYGLCALYSLILLIYPTFLTQKILTYAWGNGAQLGLKAYLIFTLLFCFLYIGGLVRIWSSYFRAKGTLKVQLLVIGLGVSITGASGFYFDIILDSPFFNNFRYIWSGPLFTTIMAVLILYAVFRLRLFSVKVIVAELLISLILIFTFLRTLLALDSREQILNGGLFVLSAIIGSLLIRSVYREVHARELIEKQEKELEQANARLRELDRQKSEFLSIAAHQLRTPLTAIKWSAGALLDKTYGDLSEEVREPVQTIFDESALMAIFINDYLNVSRIEQGRLEYHFAAADVAKILKTVAAELAPGIRAKGLELTTDVPQRPVMLWGDDGKLMQVFSNLIDNAAKYTPEGSIAVSLRVKPEEKVARIEIKDTGIGVTKDTLETIFNKFVRGEKAAAVNNAGAGLGLFVVRTFVEAHKGRVWPESEGEGKGTTFIVELPLLVQK